VGKAPGLGTLVEGAEYTGVPAAGADSGSLVIGPLVMGPLGMFAECQPVEPSIGMPEGIEPPWT
jgi:hypothetical protein